MVDPNGPCEWTLDRIEAFLDGELKAGEREGFEAHCRACAGCALELSLAIRIRAEIRSLPVFAAPDRVIVKAARQAALDSSAVVPISIARARRVRWLPAVAAALIAVTAAVWLGTQRRNEPAPVYSEAEIRRASAEVALAFGYVGEYGDEAAEVLREDVLQKRVMPRIERALKSSGESAIHDTLVPELKRAVRESGLDVTSPAPGRS